MTITMMAGTMYIYIYDAIDKDNAHDDGDNDEHEGDYGAWVEHHEH